MSDDGSITAARWLREAEPDIDEDLAGVEPVGIDMTPVTGEVTWLVGEGRADVRRAAHVLARLIDPVTRPAADGTCERCGAGPEALRDAYCAHCGRRIVRDEEDGR